jgi:hypothetical protein
MTDYQVSFDDGERVWDGDVLDDGTWEIWVPVGTYDVRLEVYDDGLSSGGGPVPVLTADVTGPTTLALDSTAAAAAVQVRLATAAGEQEVGNVWLETEDAEWGDAADAGLVDVHAPTGTYTLWASYGGWSRGETAGSVPLDPAFVLSADTSVSYDVPLYDVGGLLSVSGLTLAEGTRTTDCPELQATDAAQGLYLRAPCPGSPTWHMVLPAGTYDFTLTTPEWGARAIPLAEDVVVAGDTALDLTGEMVTVTGTVTYDGGDPPLTDDGEVNWYLTFTDLDHGDAYALRFQENGAWTATLPRGTYAVTFANGPNLAFDTVSGAIPVSDTFEAVDGATLDVDIALVDVDVTASLDGAIASEGRAWLRGTSVAQEVHLDGDGRGTFRVPPGDYGLYLVAEEADAVGSYDVTLSPCVSVYAP